MADTPDQRMLSRRQFVHILGTGAAASSVALLLAACQSAAPVAPASTSASGSVQGTRGGTLTIALSAEPVDMDPANSGGTPTSAAEQLIYNTLVRNTPEQTVRPDLAASWTAQDDVWTF